MKENLEIYNNNPEIPQNLTLNIARIITRSLKTTQLLLGPDLLLKIYFQIICIILLQESNICLTKNSL